MAVEALVGSTVAREPAGPVARPAVATGCITVTIARDIADVEAAWRALEATGTQSPAQSYDFIRLWVQSRAIRPAAQAFVVGSVDGRPVALLPLHLRPITGVRVYTWFPGPHLGVYAPVMDVARVAELGPAGRRALWAAMTEALSGADLVYLRAIPQDLPGYGRLFDELGECRFPGDVLHRAAFASWEEADRVQRSRSRRKHDRQQGDRLNALGAVSFEMLDKSQCPPEVIATMFAQRARRFAAQGIRDPFRKPGVRAFYEAALHPDSGVAVKVHVLRLEGAIVAVRYSIEQDGKLFCLISSMSDDRTVRAGSPGKQCLLRVMQTVFDQGYGVFDMGSGLTDEKRHWCNQSVPLNGHYQALTPWGQAVLFVHARYHWLRLWVKTHPGLARVARDGRHSLFRLLGWGSRSEDE
jgi:CelD/BcsL family acetyltransferase involved in cellulose biosynthesis